MGSWRPCIFTCQSVAQVSQDNSTPAWRACSRNGRNRLSSPLGTAESNRQCRYSAPSPVSSANAWLKVNADSSRRPRERSWAKVRKPRWALVWPRIRPARSSLAGARSKGLLGGSCQGCREAGRCSESSMALRTAAPCSDKSWASLRANARAPWTCCWRALSKANSSRNAVQSLCAKKLSQSCSNSSIDVAGSRALPRVKWISSTA